MTNEDIRIKGEFDAISSHLRPIFTAESKIILKREEELARLIQEYTERPLRYCHMYVSQMSPMAVVATWHKLRAMRAAIQKELAL